MFLKLSRKLFYYVLFNVIVAFATSQRTKDKMFNSVIGTSCFKRLNGTHETGCSSDFGGSVGVLHLVRSVEDFDFITNDPPAPPYAVIVPPNLFNRDNIMRLKSSKFVSAIVLINNHTDLQTFSHESRCPNQFSGLKEQTCDVNTPADSWNPSGTGLLYENFPFPIFYIADKEHVDNVVGCFEKFNNFNLTTQHERSLCSIQINSFMSAAVNSEVCLRRSSYSHNLSPTRYCDPLKGRNVFATLFPRETVKSDEIVNGKKEKFILVSARMDTTSMFDGVGLGAQDSLVSYTTLVATAHLLSKIMQENSVENNRNVLFIWFNGESYDFIGSQRFVYDISKGLFPPRSHHRRAIDLEDIELMIDIGALDDPTNLMLYRSSEFEKANQLYALLSRYNDQFGLNLTLLNKQSLNLPPTSAQSILRENATFPAVILNSKPTNKFYHSIYDDADNINYQYRNLSKDFTILRSLRDTEGYADVSIQITIRNISSALAFSLYELIAGKAYAAEKGANPILIDEILHCFLQSTDCPLFRASILPGILPGYSIPPLRYISVQGSYTHETYHWTQRILGFLIGQKVANSEENCTQLPLQWFAGLNGTGECHLTTQNSSIAASPAFLLDDYDWSSGKYSTWTESTWRELNARIFLKPSTSHEAATFAFGFSVLIISFFIVFFINSKSDILFGDSMSSETEQM